MFCSLPCKIDAKSFVTKIKAKLAPITSWGGIPIIINGGSSNGAPPSPERPIAIPTIKPIKIRVMTNEGSEINSFELDTTFTKSILIESNNVKSKRENLDSRNTASIWSQFQVRNLR